MPWSTDSDHPERGGSVVRWTTADNDHRARQEYDEHATRVDWTTCDMAPTLTGSG